MKLTTTEIQVLEWAAADLDKRAEEVEQFIKRDSSFRHEAALIRGIIERGKNETEEDD